jgi:uncharacterized protein (DUF1330 family)
MSLMKSPAPASRERVAREAETQLSPRRKTVPAYVVAMMSIHDPLIYREYTDRTPATMKKYGGKFLTRGEPVTTVEGEEYKDRMVILEFPSVAQVQAWFADPAYQEAMAFRHAASTMRLLVVQEGGANTEDPNPNL